MCNLLEANRFCIWSALQNELKTFRIIMEYFSQNQKQLLNCSWSRHKECVLSASCGSSCNIFNNAQCTSFFQYTHHPLETHHPKISKHTSPKFKWIETLLNGWSSRKRHLQPTISWRSSFLILKTSFLTEFNTLQNKSRFNEYSQTLALNQTKKIFFQHLTSHH